LELLLQISYTKLNRNLLTNSSNEAYRRTDTRLSLLHSHFTHFVENTQEFKAL